jgi:hypothetical protein
VKLVQPSELIVGRSFQYLKPYWRGILERNKYLFGLKNTLEIN